MTDTENLKAIKEKTKIPEGYSPRYSHCVVSGLWCLLRAFLGFYNVPRLKNKTPE